MKLGINDIEVMESTCSMPCGRPASREGKLMDIMLMLELEGVLDFPMILETRGMFNGVVTMVAVTPLAAKSLAMSSVGMRWPWARKGRKNMCSF